MRKKAKVKEWSETSKDNVQEIILSTESKQVRREKKRSKISKRQHLCSRHARGDSVRVDSGTKNRLKRSQKKRGINRSLKGAWHSIISRASLGGTDAGGPVGHLHPLSKAS